MIVHVSRRGGDLLKRQAGGLPADGGVPARRAPDGRRAIFLAGALLLAPAAPRPASGGGAARERRLEITERLLLGIPTGSRSVRLWIPRLADDTFQSAELVRVDAPWGYKITRDPEFGNRLVYFEAASPRVKEARVELFYRVSRKEQAAELGDSGAASPLFNKPRGLVAVNGDIRRIAREVAENLADPMEKARALYVYVLSRMAYDTSGSGWGRGDAAYACRVGRGNCTDFHSLFMALAMEEKIPVRFKIGYPLPGAPEGPVLKPYHCWAEFHAAGRGWIPVDISEAWKHPAKADYYFGHLDADRVLVSTGRDIRLSPAQAGPPLNYMVRPYAEADGKPILDMEFNRSYRNINGGTKT